MYSRIKNYNFALCFKNSLSGSTKLKHKPLEAYLEVTNICNLKCIMCAAQTFDSRYRQLPENTRIMSFETLQKLEKYLPYIARCYLMGNGEPLLNKDLIRIIKLLKKYRIYVTFNTNAALLNEAIANDLVFSEIDSITISIDGASSETYERIRIGANLNKVVSNIRKLNKIKNRLKSNKPQLVFECVLMSNNVHEAADMVILAKELNVQHIHFEALIWQNDPKYIDFYNKHKLSNVKKEDLYSYFDKAITFACRNKILITSQFLNSAGEFDYSKIRKYEPQ